MSSKYMEGAEPFFIKGKNYGCLLLHGAGGGTTWDLKEFANTLHEKTGMTIWLPALSGFGTKPEDLYNVSFDDWQTDSHDGIDKLRETCEHICIVGHSMGGLLALLLASERKEIKVIVTWAAPLGVRNRFLPLLPTISKIHFLKRLVPEKYPAPVPDWLREQGWVGYDWIPTSIGLDALEGIRRLKKVLRKIMCPALIIQGSIDQSISKNSASRIYDGIASDKKEIWIIAGADHPIMNEVNHKDELFIRTIAFLEENFPQ